MFEVPFHHRPRTLQMIGQHRAWHAIIAFGQHTQSNEFRLGMVAYPLDTTHYRKKSSVASHHNHYKEHTIERCCAWHVIIDLG